MAQTFGPAESIGRGAVEYQSPNVAAAADGCAMIAVGLNLEFTAGPVATRAYVDAAIQAIAISGSTATALVGLLYGNGSNVSIASSANVVAALGYSPANRAGDTFTGNVLTANANYFGWADAQLRRTAAGAVGAFGADGTTAGTLRANFFANSGGVGIQTTPGDLLTTWGFNNGLLVIPPSSNIAWAASFGAPFVLSNNSVIIGRGAGTVFQTQSADGLRVRNLANNAFAPAQVGVLTANGLGQYRGVGAAAVLMQTGIDAPGLCMDSGVGVSVVTHFGGEMLFYNRSTSGNVVGGDLAMTINASRTLILAAGLRLGVFTVATLPSASANPSAIATVTDSSVTTNGSPVAGGGANRVMVFSNGTTWDVVVA